VSGGREGFTLLEIMLAMLILGMVVAMVSVSLSGSIRVMEGAMDQGDVYYRAQVALERISEDLASAALTEDTDFVSGKEGGLEQSRLLTFASLAHLSFDSGKGLPGLGLISYALQPDKNNSRQLLLLRADSLRRPVGEEKKGGETEAFLLADRLRSVKFTFFNRNGEEQDSWDTTVKKDEEDEKERVLPAAVACRLEFWLDEEQDASVSFQTMALLPAGLIRPQPKEN
jgi:prepilin-type N-terminal cleavage/methylation domain-containing protein